MINEKHALKYNKIQRVKGDLHVWNWNQVYKEYMYFLDN